jgi:glycosyltransferase involved in cell wall biosynthesis
MRIAVATRYGHRVAGVETYLEGVLPALAARGHDLDFWHESALAPGIERIAPPAITSRWMGDSGTDINRSLQILSEGAPDVIFLHGLSDPALEGRLGTVAPLAILLHAYHGTCISGSKTHSYPSPHVCSRTLGPGCLLYYYPRRCGGWSPITLITSYARQRERQALLRSSGCVLTLSEHMRLECIAHGADPALVTRLPLFTPPVDDVVHHAKISRLASGHERLHLLFAGRMEKLKGGAVFLDALDRLDESVRRNLRVTFAGDGPERSSWEQRAAQVSRGEFEIRFVGWLPRSTLYKAVDLLVVPSLWPEPLGLVGLEAAAEGIPSVAFDVGGIREWLIDGVTGRLVPANPPSGATLARSLEDCIRTPGTLASWGNAAKAATRHLTLAKHVDALERVLARVAGRQPELVSMTAHRG